MKLKGFDGISYYPTRAGTLRLAVRNNGKLEWYTVKTIGAAFDFAEQFYARLAENAVDHHRRLKPKIGFEVALDGYPPRMIFRGKLAGLSSQRYAINTLRKIFSFCKWNSFDDFSHEKFQEYMYSRRAHPACLHKEVATLKAFVSRFEDEGVIMPRWLAKMKMPRPESSRLHNAMSDDKHRQWWAYLTKGMERLACQDPTWSWAERILRCCETAEEAERMLLIVTQILQGRGLYRPGESRRVQVCDWNGRTQMLELSEHAKKAKMKTTLADAESAWIYNVAAMGRTGEEPLAQSTTGRSWSISHLYHTTRRHLDAAGLNEVMPYDIKYTLATFIYDHPECFQDEDHDRRIARVRAVLGHSSNSLETERYIQSRWGSEFGAGIQSYFNTQRLFPFDVSKFPVAPQYHPSSRRERRP